MFEKLDNKIKQGFLYKFDKGYTMITGIDGVRKYIALRRSAGHLEEMIEKSIEISADKGKTFRSLWETKVEKKPKTNNITIEHDKGTTHLFGDYPKDIEEQLRKVTNGK